MLRRTTRAAVQVFAAAALVWLVAGAASAQTFRGTVTTDSTKRPLENALVSLYTDKGVPVERVVTRTDSTGKFVLHAGEPGKYRVRVTRVGYQPLLSDIVNFFGGEVVSLDLNMSQAAQRLGAVTVTEKRRFNRDELLSGMGFDLRRSAGNGKFADSADMAEYKKYPVAWMLADHAGFGLDQSLRMPGGRMGTCAPEVWLDGWPTGLWVLEGLSSNLIYGIEVYSRFQLPPPSIGGEIGADQYTRPTMQRCGAIVVWTRAFTEKRAEELRQKELQRAKKLAEKKGSGG